jgi:16S rRNA (guanine(527)-N(7))-methyltransferase RsmG
MSLYEIGQSNLGCDDLLKAYVDLLVLRNAKMNLIQSDSVPLIMNRHIKDCEQICSYINKGDVVVDVGSGAGLPGVVMAICGFSNIVLCEKSRKKSVFLHEVRSKLGLSFEIYNGDIYNLQNSEFAISNYEPKKGRIMVSRAFGSISKLLDVMCKTSLEKGVFHKGKQYLKEIEVARKNFAFDYIAIPSITCDDGFIVTLFNCRRK